MAGLPALLQTLNAGKHFPYKNATPRSSVSLGLLYDLGVIGAGSAPGGGDTSALEAKITALEKKVDDLQAELDTFTAGTNHKTDLLTIKAQEHEDKINQNTLDLGLHDNNGKHWTQDQIDERVDAYVKANSGPMP